jgi:hypothetical protein
MVSTINNLLFSVQNMSPAFLSIGPGKTQNYSNLADMTSLLDATGNGGALSDLSGLTGAGSGTGSTDTVSLTYKNIGDKIVGDLAAVTAGAIKDNPSLDGDYVIALIDDGSGSREARVYSRKTILENFEGTAEEKEALKKQLEANPLMVFNNASGLPPTADDSASQNLAKSINTFLKTTDKTLNTLDKAGYDPLANLLGNSTMKKILANCANPFIVTDPPSEAAPEATEEAADSATDDVTDEPPAEEA